MKTAVNFGDGPVMAGGKYFKDVFRRGPVEKPFAPRTLATHVRMRGNTECAPPSVREWGKGVSKPSSLLQAPHKHKLSAGNYEIRGRVRPTPPPPRLPPTLQRLALPFPPKRGGESIMELPLPPRVGDEMVTEEEHPLALSPPPTLSPLQ